MFRGVGPQAWPNRRPQTGTQQIHPQRSQDAQEGHDQNEILRKGGERNSQKQGQARDEPAAQPEFSSPLFIPFARAGWNGQRDGREQHQQQGP